MRKVVFLEFNELSPTLLNRWMAAGQLPNFKRFHDQSQVFVGTADMPARPDLEPWIQWYSLHTGLSYPQHRVYHLTDGPKAGHVDIWHHLLAHGYSVGNCAGMNAPGFAAPGSFYIPDPWCNTESPYPEELRAYQRVILGLVQENSNAAAAPGKSDYLALLGFLATHGLSSTSVTAAARQLLTEARNPKASWKRAAILDKLQFDIFKHYWTRFQPDFASFFANSTAHFQHSYFHLLEPDKFALPEDMMRDAEHRDAIFFGYQQMDAMLGAFFRLEQRHGLMLVLSTALSQEADPEVAYLYYRPRGIEQVFARLGIDGANVLPVMAHQYSVPFPDETSAAGAKAKLETLSLDGRPVFTVQFSDPTTLFFGSNLHHDIAAGAMIIQAGSNLGVPFYDLFYRVPHSKTGVHHPDSVLWFKTGQHAVHKEKTSILNVFPTLSDYYGIPGDSAADGLTRTGRSILGELGLGRYRHQQRQAA